MMRSFLLLLRSLGILLAGFGAVLVVNLPHDWLLNAGAPGSAYEQVPLGRRAAIWSMSNRVSARPDPRPPKPIHLTFGPNL